MYGDLLNTIGFVETADPEVGEAMELELNGCDGHGTHKQIC